VTGAVVFGGAGFIGSHLLASLVARGYDRVVSADVAEPRRRIPNVDYQFCDVTRRIDLDGSGVDELYNLGGLVTTPGHPAADYLRTNVAGALRTSDFADLHGISTVVFTSTMSVYPTGEALKTEQTEPDPTNAYGESKLLAEQVHQQWRHGASGRRLVISRPAVIFGPGERGNFARLHRLIAARRFAYPGRRDTIKACGYVSDLIDSFAFVADMTEDETLYNFAYVDRLTIAEICHLVAQTIGRADPRVAVPFGAMAAAALPFEALERAGVRTGISRARLHKLVESTNIYPQLLVDKGFIFGTTPADGIKRWIDAMEESAS
jgi:nucleoside-diphosphate-sugar epimerase